MITLEDSTIEHPMPWQQHGDAVAFVSAMLLSIALVAFFVFRGNEFLAIGIGFALIGIAAVLLMGNVFKWAVYCFFCVQYTVSYFFMPTASVVIGISLLFFPIALFGKNSLDAFRDIPNKKSLLLMLAGGAVSLIYMTFVNSGIFENYVIYDLYFLLGLIFAYQLYILFKLEILDPKKLVECIGFSAAVVILVLIAMYVRRDWSLMFSERFGLTIMRNENPNTLACYINIALPCAIFTAFFEKKNRVKQILFYGLSLFYVCILLMTGSRGGLPGIAILFAYFIWQIRSNKLFLMILLISMIFVFFLIGSNVMQRTFRPDVGDAMSTVGRFDYWRAAVEVLKENYYFFGIGMHNYSLVKYDYGISTIMHIDAHSHNVFLDIWLGWGLCGLLGWLIFNAVITKSIMHLRKKCAMASSVIFAIIIFSIYGLVECPINRPRIMVAYFALVGVGFFLMSQGNGDLERKCIHDVE